MNGNDCVNYTDYLGMALMPYSGDVSNLALAPNSSPLTSMSQINEQGEAGVTWPAPVATANGTQVVISGSLILAPTYLFRTFLTSYFAPN